MSQATDLAALAEKYSSLPELAKRVVTTRRDIDNDTEWSEWRRNGIGGSDVGAILGLSSFSSPWKVFAEKTGMLPPSESTQRQEIGHLMEPVIGELFKRETGLVVVGEQTWLQHPTQPWRRCTVDGFSAEAADTVSIEDATGVVEYKSDGRFSWPDGLPDSIRCQAVWNLGVSGLERTWVAVMFAGWKFKVFCVERDARAEADLTYMVGRAEEFWDLVCSGTPPEMDGSQATLDALSAVYPDCEPGTRVELDPDQASRYRWAQDASNAYGKVADLHKAHILAEMGENELGCVDGVPVVSLRKQPGRKTTCSACGHTDHGEPFRVLRAASKKDQA